MALLVVSALCTKIIYIKITNIENESFIGVFYKILYNIIIIKYNIIMELAIPGIALGFLYIVSNQSKSSKDGFKDRSQLPNVDIPNRNYPDEYPVSSIDGDLTSQLSTTNQYDNGGGVYTDKYFNPNLEPSSKPSIFYNSPTSSASSQQYYNLTGNKVDASYFEHNNMVPFFGSNLRSRVANENTNEGLLDSYSGAGSQTIIKKEQAPLFSPIDNAQWAYGAPNESDFYQSRVNPSMRMANVTPFAQEMVGPGLGLGYTTEGSGGFNSGMAMRDAWLDKSADQLRVDNKPKATGLGLYGHEGPANSYIKTNATYEHMGVMEKHLPDQSFELDNRDFSNSGSRDIGRLFTTGGVEKGQTMHAMPIDRYVTRPETAVTYAGGAGYQNSAAYVPGEYMPTHMQQLGALPLAVANANGRSYATDSDYGVKSKMAYPNNRTSNKQDSYFGLVSGSLGAAVAPLLDILRPSRKENVIGTLRPYQNPGTTVPQSYIFNPADRLNTTIRETTENSKFHLNVNANQLGGAYQVTEQQTMDHFRKIDNDYYYSGNAGAGPNSRQPASYEAGYNQRNNDIKASTIDGRLVPGNMSLLNGDINMRQVSRDNMLLNSRPIAGNMPYQSPDIQLTGRNAATENKLYANINSDRNTSDIMNSLKSNPYIVDYKNAL